MAGIVKIIVTVSIISHATLQVELVQAVVARKDGKALVAAWVCIGYNCLVNVPTL